jgi:hypothetical protein
MRRHLMFHLYPKQGVAFFSTATEMLYGGANRGGRPDRPSRRHR